MKCNNPSCQICRWRHLDLFSDKITTFSSALIAELGMIPEDKPFVVIPPAPKTIKPRVGIEAFKAIHSNKAQREAMMLRIVESSRSFADAARPFIARAPGKSHMTEFQRKVYDEVSKMKGPVMLNFPRKTGGFIIMDELGTVREDAKKETWFDKLFKRNKTNKE